MSNHRLIKLVAIQNLIYPMADFKGRIRRIRIKERGNGKNYKVTVVVGDDEQQAVNSVKLEFIPPYEGPAPTTNQFLCPLKSTNPGKNTARYIYDELSFEKDPKESYYLVVATMLNADQKVLGSPIKHEVVAEEHCDVDEVTTHSLLSESTTK